LKKKKSLLSPLPLLLQNVQNLKPSSKKHGLLLLKKPLKNNPSILLKNPQKNLKKAPQKDLWVLALTALYLNPPVIGLIVQAERLALFLTAHVQRSNQDKRELLKPAATKAALVIVLNQLPERAFLKDINQEPPALLLTNLEDLADSNPELPVADTDPLLHVLEAQEVQVDLAGVLCLRWIRALA
jgi:hypothetical protein